MFDSVFFKSTMFCGTFSSMNNYIWKIPKWKIVLVQGEKIDYQVDPVKSVKTGRLTVAPGKLTGLLSFLPFLQMEQYYKKAL